MAEVDLDGELVVPQMLIQRAPKVVMSITVAVVEINCQKFPISHAVLVGSPMPHNLKPS